MASKNTRGVTRATAPAPIVLACEQVNRIHSFLHAFLMSNVASQNKSLRGTKELNISCQFPYPKWQLLHIKIFHSSCSLFPLLQPHTQGFHPYPSYPFPFYQEITLAAHQGTRPSDALTLNHMLGLTLFKAKLADFKEDMHSLREFVKKNGSFTPPPFSGLKKNTPLHSKRLVITTLLMLSLFILLN